MKTKYRYLNTRIPTCPYCGNEDRDNLVEISVGGKDVDTTEPTWIGDCSNCRRHYRIIMNVTYSSEPIKAKRKS